MSIPVIIHPHGPSFSPWNPPSSAWQTAERGVGKATASAAVLEATTPLVPYLTPQRVRLFNVYKTAYREILPRTCTFPCLAFLKVAAARHVESNERRLVYRSDILEAYVLYMFRSMFLLIAFRSATSASLPVRDAPDSSYHVMEAASNATYFSTIPIPKAKQSSLNNCSSVVTLLSTVLCKRLISYNRTAKAP
jgi:hypothetical protein